MSDSCIVAIVQARMEASRLPNKMMLHLHGYPLIEWVYRRSVQSRLIDKLVIAIPDTTENDILESYLRKIGADVFRGSKNNVLDRVYHAAQKNNATHCIRICADNPFISPVEIDNLIRYFLKNSCDYAYNHIPVNNAYPNGLGAEILPFNILKEIYRKATTPSQIEHICNYIWDNKDNFRIKTFDPPDKDIAHPDIKLDIDTFEDYKKFIDRDLKIDMAAKDIVSLFLKINH